MWSDQIEHHLVVFQGAVLQLTTAAALALGDKGFEVGLDGVDRLSLMETSVQGSENHVGQWLYGFFGLVFAADGGEFLVHILANSGTILEYLLSVFQHPELAVLLDCAPLHRVLLTVPILAYVGATWVQNDV